MRASFSVLNDSWIPVVTLDGTKELLGIRETLRRSHELREISTVSPLEEFSLYRFLSVFLMDALQPKRNSAIRSLLKQGQFDMESIEEYISLCKKEGVSFDLFDEKRPFMQSAYVEEWDKEPKPISSIDCFLPSGNNHLHFEHGSVEQRSITADKAARLLLAIQQFCTAAAQGYPSGVNASPPYFGVVKADTLFETLVYQLFPIQKIDNIPFDDPPVIWRSMELVESKKTVPQTSWLRGMLFPARRVNLVSPADGVNINQIYLSQGENFVNKETWTDPFVSYRFLDTGRVPLRPKGEKPIWRSMFEIADIRGNCASQLLSQYIELADTPYVHVTMYGVETNQASYLDVMRHDLRFRRDLTTRDSVIDLLKKSVKVSERLARSLRHCLRDNRDNNIVPENLANDAVIHYYSQCEKYFWTMCENTGAADSMKTLFSDWCQEIGRYAQDAYSGAIRNVNLRGRTLAKASEQQRRLSVEIKKIKEEAEE